MAIECIQLGQQINYVTPYKSKPGISADWTACRRHLAMGGLPNVFTTNSAIKTLCHARQHPTLTIPKVRKEGTFPLPTGIRMYV